MGGRYGIVTSVKILEEIRYIQSGVIEIGCNGMSVLNRSFLVDKDKISSKQVHFNMISCIHGLTEKSKVHYNTRHIKEHPDDIAEADLDRWALLNIERDIRAK